MIPKDILEKYYMKTLDGYKEDFGDTIDTEKMFYETFLIQTDHIPLKIFEEYITFMVENNVNVGNMKKFFNDVKEEYADVLEARKFAREEINRLQATE